MMTHVVGLSPVRFTKMETLIKLLIKVAIFIVVSYAVVWFTLGLARGF